MIFNALMLNSKDILLFKKEEQNRMKNTSILHFEQLIQNDYSNITGILVQKNDSKVYEQYFNGYTPKDAVHIFSVTKSVFSTLIGIAIEKGYIKGVEEKVLDFFPDYTIPEGETTIQNITIRHLLTMTAPYKYKEEPYAEFFASEDWVTAALDLLGGEYTGEFLYAAIVGTHILSGILANATGTSTLEFANANLFHPLGITVPQNVFLRSKEEHFAVMSTKGTRGWVADPQGRNPASWGLFLTPEEMAKIGQLYYNGGMWNNEQLLPAWWVEESTKEHSRWGELSYGYLWWVINEKEHIYAAIGDGGNVVYVNEKKGLVIAIAALFLPNVTDRIRLIQEHIEPLFESL